MKEFLDAPLIEKIVSIAEEAGRAVMEVYLADDYGTTYKSDDSPLTRADTEAHDVILNGLEAIEPAFPVLSEESVSVPYDIRKDWKTFWLVDPLDGTKEFLRRNGEFTVNIALIHEGFPVLGVVGVPALGRVYFGAVEKGAFKREKGKTVQISAAGYCGGRLRVVGSRSHGSGGLKRFLDRAGDHECMTIGSSLKFCLVAEGKAHIYPRFGPTMEWDTGAAQCIVEAAGGMVTDLRGSRLLYNKPDLKNPFFIASGSPAFPWEGVVDGVFEERGG